jgi:hypothetical protein
VEGDALDCPGERLKRLLLIAGRRSDHLVHHACRGTLGSLPEVGKKATLPYAERRIAGMYVPILFYPRRQACGRRHQV